MTYTNVLTLLDLGGVPLRSADRAEDAPLILGGGPTATHPEPVAPFFDAFFIGEAEEELPDLLCAWAARRPELRGRPGARLDALADLAAGYPLYVPALYRTRVEPVTGALVVDAPLDARAPATVRRGLVEDLDRFPFPGDAPVAHAEAVFDRQAVEIARGCTEGCRFCQAGMIYRPVRERSPDSIVDSVVGGVTRGGYDETSLTSLSTADHSCITPLVKRVMGELRERRVSLSVSSLRAYGLGEEILDELASVRATGLTFAPEAGTQRMRDVVNKNVTEAHIEESAHRIFTRGWNRLKLYFMIGLPTETDEDVLGVVDTGRRMLEVGRSHIGRRAEVTVAVSSHVPKPHTPFQWCAMDAEDEILRKQRLLRAGAHTPGLRLKTHDSGISHVEGILARGDRRLADAIELCWRRGARFDGWDEGFDPVRWQAAFADLGIATDAYLATIPVTARLPWDHIDVGLEDGFLLGEYRRALADRLSPPCGKPFGELLHHDNLADALADGRKLVCYDCGVACDLTRMREDRLVALRDLGAHVRTAPLPRSEPAPRRRPPRPRPAFVQSQICRYRLRYAKLGRAAFLGHLDVGRVLQRILRRADVPAAYSRGFHPKPIFEFGPALALGVPSLGEIVDVSLTVDLDPAALRDRLREVCPEGIDILTVIALPPGAPRLAKLVDAYHLAILPAPDGVAFAAARLDRLARACLARDRIELARGDDRTVDVRPYLAAIDVLAGDDAARLCAALDWAPAPALLGARVRVTAQGSAKPMEVAVALGVAGGAQPTAPRAHLARLGLSGGGDGPRLDPLALPVSVAIFSGSLAEIQEDTRREESA
jgi:radical SAM family uncharacterized protein/radical SAM-linked protein